jgi:hypothetical protein
MAKKRVIDLETYGALDAWAISLQEMYKALRRAGFSVDLALAVIVEPMAYPRWILPDPIEPEKLGDYEDDEDDD